MRSVERGVWIGGMVACACVCVCLCGLGCEAWSVESGEWSVGEQGMDQGNGGAHLLVCECGLECGVHGVARRGMVACTHIDGPTTAPTSRGVQVEAVVIV